MVMDILFVVIGLGIGAILINVWRRFIAGGWCYSTARLDGKTVIVTGANTGIGKETAKELAKRGAKVILACRNLTKAQTAADDIRNTTSSDKILIRELDLSSLASVRKFAQIINDEEDRLDILINNAGVAFIPKSTTKDGFEMTIGRNHFGHFLLTNLLLDLLKKSAPSRVVTVASTGYNLVPGMRFDDINLKEDFSTRAAYGQSKLANVLFTIELSKRLQGSGVTANVLHPGAIKTKLDRNAASTVPLAIISVPILRVAIWLVGKSVVQGAQTSIYCAVEESIATTSGVYFKDCAPQTLKKHATDADTARRLWELSAEAVGLDKKINQGYDQ